MNDIHIIALNASISGVADSLAWRDWYDGCVPLIAFVSLGQLKASVAYNRAEGIDNG